jgi:hypothetical protein
MGAYRSRLLSMCVPLATMKRPKKSLATRNRARVNPQTGSEGLGPKRAVPAVLPTMAFHFQPSVQCRLRCWRSWE